MNLQRRGWLRLLVELLWLSAAGVLATTARAAPTAADKTRLQRAQVQRDAMRALVEQWNAVTGAARSLGRSAGQVEDKWGEVTAAHADDMRSAQDASKAVPRLRSAIDARIAALVALQASAQQAREAVARTARAEARSLGAAVRESEAAFKVRRRNEAAFEELGRDLRDSGLQGFDAVLSGQRHLATTRTEMVELQRELDELVASHERLLGRLAAAQAAQLRAREAGWLSGAVEPASPAAQAVPALRGAGSKTLHAYPPLRADTTSRHSATTHNDELDERAAALERLADAITYIELVDGQKSASMAAEHASLVMQRAKAQSALTETRSSLVKDVTDTEARLADLSVAIGSQQRAIDRLRELVVPASDEARQTARQLTTDIGSLLPAVQKAERSAAAEWEDAYLAVYGTRPPPAPPTTPIVEPVAKVGIGDRATASPRPSPSLGGHAYDFFDTWDKERDGYGAYTYMLLRSAEDLRSVAVRQRYERLLDVVQRQTDARDVSRRDAQSLNLFCIPVQASREQARADLAYGAALGCQIKLRMQSGLFTRPELRGRLTSSAGPFLLTLPLRIDAADSSTALLFADLASYPEAAIADLATAYMGTLLQDFPTRQTLWTPPVPQRVALSMIWFASETSALLQTAIPAAQANPSNR